jgi:hypothetical protein
MGKGLSTETEENPKAVDCHWHDDPAVNPGKFQKSADLTPWFTKEGPQEKTRGPRRQEKALLRFRAR